MEQLYNILKSIADWTDRISEKILIFLMGTMLITVLVQIFYRYIIVHFIHYSLPYTAELARYLTIWITYLGVAICLKEGIHASLDFLYNKLMSKGYSRLLLFTYIFNRIIMLYFIIVILIAGWSLLGRLSSNRSAAMQIPMVWVYGAPWVGSCLVALRLVVQIIGCYFGFEKLNKI